MFMVPSSSSYLIDACIMRCDCRLDFKKERTVFRCSSVRPSVLPVRYGMVCMYVWKHLFTHYSIGKCKVSVSGFLTYLGSFCLFLVGLLLFKVRTGKGG